MKVVHILGTPAPGGAQRLVLDLSAAFESLDLECRTQGVMFTYSRTGSLLPEFLATGATYFSPIAAPPVGQARFYRPQRLGRHIMGRYQMLRDLPRQLEASGADIVHAHVETAFPWILIAARRAGIPLVMTLHSSIVELDRLETLIIRREISRSTMKRQFVAVGGQGKEVMGSVFGVPSERVRVIRNGVKVFAADVVAAARARIRQELGIDQDEFVVGSVSRLHYAKRLDLIVDAISILRGRGTHVRGLLVGDGPARAELLARVESHGLHDRVLLPGGSADGSASMAALDVFLLTSDHEGMPIAMLEAASVGIPIISRRIGDVGTFIHHDVNGLCLDAMTPELLADRIEQLRAAPATRRRYAEAARLEVERAWSINTSARAYNSTYADCMQE